MYPSWRRWQGRFVGGLIQCFDFLCRTNEQYLRIHGLCCALVKDNATDVRHFLYNSSPKGWSYRRQRGWTKCKP